MNITQNNNSGNNIVRFTEIKDFEIEKNTKKIKSFKNSDEIGDFIKSNKKSQVIAYIITFLTFIFSPLYGYYIAELINNLKK